MRPHWLLLVAAGVLPSLTVPARAQPIFGYAESIECTVANCDVVVIGKVVQLGVGKEADVATIAVEETLKGEHRERLRVRFDIGTADPAKWKEDSRRLLVAARGNPASATRVIDLSDKKLAVLTADMTLLRKPVDVIRMARETLRRMPGVKQIDTFALSLPLDAVAGTKWARKHGVILTVPVNQRLEKRAHAYILAKDAKNYSRRVEGARALRYFKSNENIARAKGLLNDPDWSFMRRAEENRGLEVRFYGVREAAYESLKYWGVKVKEPTTREETWKPELVRSVVLSDTEVDGGELQKLGRFKNLKSLYATNTKLTDEHVKVISGFSTLQGLALGNTKVTDAGLKHLAVLKDLRSLELGVTRVTDAGLKELAGFQDLKYLYLNGARGVTDAGLKELAGLKKLAVLDLRRTRVTDAGLKELAGLMSLKELYLEGAQVTAGGVAELRQARPSLKIHH